MDPVRSPWLVAFGVAAMTHLGLLATEASPWDSVTKCLIAPLLAVWVLEQRGPHLVVGALMLCFVGDLLTEFDDLFVAGLGAFALAQVCFLTYFVRRGALGRVRRMIWVPAVLFVGAAVLLTWTWSGLDPSLRAPVAAYGLLLSATAAAALSVDLRAGAGALLFLLADGLIAARLAGRLDAGSALLDVAVMVAYSLALFLLATAIVHHESRHRSTDRFDPTRATDCWPTLPEEAS